MRKHGAHCNRYRQKSSERPSTLAPGELAVCNNDNMVSVAVDAREPNSCGEARLRKGVYVLDVSVGMDIEAPAGQRASSQRGRRVKAPTPLNLERLQFWLAQYDHKEEAELLLDGFTCGLQLGYMGPTQRCWVENLKSMGGPKQMVREKLRKDVREGYMAGPFTDWLMQNLIVSPIGMVSKKEDGQFCLIQHLSRPEGTSVDKCIPEERTAVSYASVDVAIALVEEVRLGALMAKGDMKSAFRLLPVHPDELLGMQFKGY
ncbi:hypothetical protein NDU88_004311 [Pleurodeles waltl]|uniref:Reverse transcriptase domain-containing protein n=1 Tax=Pleurodeles waltl TaxID=8319 RepID=A0AAV7UG52_PLEWA|nr:hypothetical protein NDU88_004311 [Pleurodeles waltl]